MPRKSKPPPVRHDRESESAGFGLSFQGRAGLRTPTADRALADFRSLTTDVARAAFADHWLAINGVALEDTWTMTYELLRIVQETRLFERPMPDRKTTFPSFEAYVEHYLGSGLEAWVELESTYKFAHQIAPRLFGKRYTAARAAAARAQHAPDLAEHGGDRKSEASKDQGNQVTLIQRGQSGDYLLARLKRDHPEVLARLQQGEFPSIRAAAIAAGLLTPSDSVPRTLDGYERAIRRHLSPDQQRELAQRLLSNRTRAPVSPRKG